MTFTLALATVAPILLNSQSTTADYEKAKNICESINNMDET